MKKISGKSISVVIPVYNDPNGLRDTLESLVNQDYSKQKYEIIVADNGSNDNTPDVAKGFAKKYPKLFKIVTEKNMQSSYAARNKGIKASNGKIIAFIDADMSVDKDWLSRITEAIAKYKVDYLACKVEIYLTEKSIFGLYNKMTGFSVERCMNEDHYAPTCCLIVKKRLFDEIGLFDSRLVSSGDYEFGNRVFASEYKLYYDNSIVMKHPSRSSFKQIFSKYFRIGRGNKQLLLYYLKFNKEMYRSIFDLRYYLPSKPWKFVKSMKENIIWKKSSLFTRILFYLINWEVRIAVQIGFIYENIKIKKKKNRKTV